MARYIDEDEIAKSLYDYQWIDQDTYLDITKKIMEVPTADVQPIIHAGWETGYTFPDGAYWKCTHCKTLIKVKLPMDYCNACGAKMDKE